MNLTDIQLCADFFHVNYLKTFYLVITYNENSFILLGEKANFPHLMGIQNNTYRSHGYNRPQYLFNDIIGRNPISTSIIPNHISPNSKMYKKALNFLNMAKIQSFLLSSSIKLSIFPEINQILFHIQILHP